MFYDLRLATACVAQSNEYSRADVSGLHPPPSTSFRATWSYFVPFCEEPNSMKITHCSKRHIYSNPKWFPPRNFAQFSHTWVKSYQDETTINGVVSLSSFRSNQLACFCNVTVRNSFVIPRTWIFVVRHASPQVQENYPPSVSLQYSHSRPICHDI